MTDQAVPRSAADSIVRVAFYTSTYLAVTGMDVPPDGMRRSAWLGERADVARQLADYWHEAGDGGDLARRLMTKDVARDYAKLAEHLASAARLEEILELDEDS